VSNVLSVSDVTKVFELGSSSVAVLQGVSLELASGEALVITGPSGSGKSTLLHLIGTLEQPTTGRIEINGQDPFAVREPQMARFRNDNVGFVFQEHHLLPQYSVLENVLVPTLAFRGPDPEVTERARALLDRVGLAHRLNHRPAELSGGERQRVAVARALINRPRLLLCDEPTGNLDHRSAETVAELLFELHGEESNVLVVVTHSLELAARFDRRCELREGRCCER
jgi:lipoprotein-releasing system ATP-binding protein